MNKPRTEEEWLWENRGWRTTTSSQDAQRRWRHREEGRKLQPRHTRTGGSAEGTNWVLTGRNGLKSEELTEGLTFGLHFSSPYFLKKNKKSYMSLINWWIDEQKENLWPWCKKCAPPSGPWVVLLDP